jgi:cytosine/adenosine deaminase-related metal-dependent hydrolase
MWGWQRPIAFHNGRILTAEGVVPSMRVDARVLDLGVSPKNGDYAVDLEGAFVLPGLINAHDHLELNHFGLLKRRPLYRNAVEWIDDLRPALTSDPAIRRNQAFPLADRVFVGGLKNLLSGVTTVAHHNPVYRELRRSVPVRVVRRFGWAHSLALQGQPVGAHGEPGGDVRERCAATPPDMPFIVHAGEGIDTAAEQELDVLDAWGCLRANTVLVHGVALNRRSWARMLVRQASVVWCPASNQFLFGRTLPVRELLDTAPDAWRHVCLGTDSRITGSRDLLEELRDAHAIAALAPGELLRMVTAAAAQILRLEGAGRLMRGGPADLVVLPARNVPTVTASVEDAAGAALLATRRADMSLVMVGGRPLVGASAWRGLFLARRVDPRSVILDEHERLMAAGLARSLARCPIQEPGLTAAA